MSSYFEIQSDLKVSDVNESNKLRIININEGSDAIIDSNGVPKYIQNGENLHIFNIETKQYLKIDLDGEYIDTIRGYESSILEELVFNMNVKLLSDDDLYPIYYMKDGDLYPDGSGNFDLYIEYCLDKNFRKYKKNR